MALSLLKRLRKGPGRAGADFVAHSRGTCGRSNPCSSGHCETALNTEWNTVSSDTPRRGERQSVRVERSPFLAKQPLLVPARGDFQTPVFERGLVDADHRGEK